MKQGFFLAVSEAKGFPKPDDFPFILLLLDPAFPGPRQVYEQIQIPDQAIRI